VVQARFIVGHLNLNCHVDNGATFSCVSKQIAHSLLSHGSAEDAGSESIALDTADGRARSRYRMISARITHPSASVSKRFIVLPKINTVYDLLGMSFLDQVGCVIDVLRVLLFRNSHSLRPLAIVFLQVTYSILSS
jgi:predicted aspartyl protease